MLEFWYSERITRPIRFGFCIALCAVIYWLSHIQPLSPKYVVVSVLIGIVTHIIRHKRQQIHHDNPYREGFNILANVLPIIALIITISLLPDSSKWIPGLQVLGFSVLGLCLASTAHYREPRK